VATTGGAAGTTASAATGTLCIGKFRRSPRADREHGTDGKSSH
jgi:hypothetical protein